MIVAFAFVDKERRMKESFLAHFFQNFGWEQIMYFFNIICIQLSIEMKLRYLLGKFGAVFFTILF